MALSLGKIEQEAPELLSLAKKADEMLTNKGLNGLTAEVALVLDFSGSMGSLYRDGSVQALLNKALALATQLDDDGQIDLFIFGTTAEYLGQVDLANFRNIVAEATKGKRMSTTGYGPAFREVVRHYDHIGRAGGSTEVKSGGLFKKTVGRVPGAPADHPVLALFVTDGVPDSKEDAIRELTAASYLPIFWQFVSIGPKIEFLQKLDDLSARYIDNADYQDVPTVAGLTEEFLFDTLLKEYPAWVVEERKRGHVL